MINLSQASRCGVLNNRDPGLHICIVQSDHLVFKYVLDTWLQFVYVIKKKFSGNIATRVFRSLGFLILHSTNREADYVQTKQKGS